ncbi:hypothetical protein BaRGS_00008952 [Batillaria attramentaria]|uniref:Transposable element P transposase-like RNase H domain-containing protein n=1 Tax=Batillaria attramentaria TaxID=370345 RepID=A0ABD0LKV8_9CAEN
MTIKESTYNKEMDYVEGMEDFGWTQGRTKYVANHVMVFMARGLTVPWKQAVAYYLSSGPMKSEMMKALLCQTIDELLSIGLDVRVVIGDQGTNNRRCFETLLGVTEAEPYFLHGDSENKRKSS